MTGVECLRSPTKNHQFLGRHGGNGYRRNGIEKTGVENLAQPLKSTDPAYWMLKDGFATEPEVYRDTCSICRDPEFAQMGLPLCKLCLMCKTGHVPADAGACDDCGTDQQLASEYHEHLALIAEMRKSMIVIRDVVMVDRIGWGFTSWGSEFLAVLKKAEELDDS